MHICFLFQACCSVQIFSNLVSPRLAVFILSLLAVCFFGFDKGSSASLYSSWLQTRDLKLMPKSVRASLKVLRTCRSKIQERISAVLGKF